MYRSISCLFQYVNSYKLFKALSSTEKRTQSTQLNVCSLFHYYSSTATTPHHSQNCTKYWIISQCNEKSLRCWAFWSSTCTQRKIDNERVNRSIAKTSLIAKMKNSIRLVVGRGRRRSPFPLRTHSTENWLSSTKCLRANATKTVVQRRWQYRKLGENSLFFSCCIHTSSRTRSGKIEIVQITHTQRRRRRHTNVNCTSQGPTAMKRCTFFIDTTNEAINVENKENGIIAIQNRIAIANMPPTELDASVHAGIDSPVFVWLGTRAPDTFGRWFGSDGLFLTTAWRKYFSCCNDRVQPSIVCCSCFGDIDADASVAFFAHFYNQNRSNHYHLLTIVSSVIKIIGKTYAFNWLIERDSFQWINDIINRRSQ